MIKFTVSQSENNVPYYRWKQGFPNHWNRLLKSNLSIIYLNNQKTYSNYFLTSKGNLKIDAKVSEDIRASDFEISGEKFWSR